MPSQADDWIPFLVHLTEREDRRKATLESRATGLATVSAAVIAILTAATAIGVRTHISVPRSATIAVVIALLLFLTSILSSIVANLPLRLRQTDPSALLAEVQRTSLHNAPDIWKRIASTHIADYVSLSAANRVKAAALWFGLGAQMMGCGTLSVFILQTL
ncbi:hypothetical protein [Amycolatopsis sp. GM8]|uniref:hypothetical protein n=1 Tax=Amycolatopsis sp. GM8 TaxID=2896530 RepID=UPI001F22E16D|nr:hypothetical protein [Amycolatopsis sp. GM8]